MPARLGRVLRGDAGTIDWEQVLKGPQDIKNIGLSLGDTGKS